jgi:hypothetical protein
MSRSLILVVEFTNEFWPNDEVPDDIKDSLTDELINKLKAITVLDKHSLVLSRRNPPANFVAKVVHAEIKTHEL